MTDDQIKILAESLTPEQRQALRPCAPDRQCLVKPGLAYWGQRNPRHRYPSLKLSNLGYKVRDYLGLTEPVTA